MMEKRRKQPDFPSNKKGELLVTRRELIDLLTNNTHGYGYYHLTVWPSLCKMLEPVAVPGDPVKHRMMHFGAAVNMNDIKDKRCGRNVFFTSFSFGPTENISMWTNYGIPNKDAVRIMFWEDDILAWVDAFNESKIRVYGVESSGSLTPLAAKVELKHVDVAYWSKKDVGLNCEDPNEGLFFHDTSKYRLKGCRDVNRFMEERQYYFKEFGWNYEREVRLILVFDEDVADRYKRVAVPFDKPLATVAKHFSRDVMHGPWLNEKSVPEKKAAGHSLGEARPSRYNGLVKMRSVCDVCPKQEQNEEECTCPFRGQR